LALVAVVAGAVVSGLGFKPAPGPDVPPTKAAAPEAKAEPAKAPVKGRTFTGTVVGADGKAVGAELFFLPRGEALRAMGRADDRGAFSVTLPETPGTSIGHLLARADGHGVVGRTVWRGTPNELRLALPADFAVRGRVIDLQGRPVVGATVVPLG